MNTFAINYKFSITEYIISFFSSKINQICSSSCLEENWPRFLITALLIFLITAFFHSRQRITFFYDKTDALLTIFTPIIAVIPLGILALIFYFLNNDFNENWIISLLIDSYFFTLLYLLLCSFRYARRSNPYNFFGFLLSCLGRLFSIVSIFSLAIGVFGLFFPRADPNRYHSQIELDYIWLRSFAIFGACYSALIWLVLKLTRRKIWGSTKYWLTLR